MIEGSYYNGRISPWHGEDPGSIPGESINKMLIDIHCHLDALSEAGKNIDLVIKMAREKNVGIIVTNGVNFKSNEIAINFSKKYQEVKASLGIYPIDSLFLTENEINQGIEFKY